ncbi:MAG: hypothetical protein HY372_02705 [Candidatus Andersenbacteria bacterium]|nr:hypothetical protein [Candidatus Andersenbacteria bacterium]
MIAGFLLFAAGWQFGRASSPYYAAHPIIFEDNGGGSRGELTTLREQGLAGAGPSETPTALPISAPAVAGSTTDNQGVFVGSVNSDLYHHLDCPASQRIKEANQVWFNSVQQAAEAGYKPSKCTQEKLKQ